LEEHRQPGGLRHQAQPRGGLEIQNAEFRMQNSECRIKNYFSLTPLTTLTTLTKRANNRKLS
ncbi:MAG: hypothetical protein IIX40_02515, partial [Alistipes sp.]|nr:hypothetical protein [Alistipes sp.]